MRVLILILALLPVVTRADDTRVRLYADPALVETGLIQHIRPRFSLKTQVGVDMVASPEAADIVLGTQGRALFDGLGQTWHLEQRSDGARVQRFSDWLTSEIGARTIRSFAPQGTALFSDPSEKPVVVEVEEVWGDAKLGRDVSYAKCGRCHVTEKGRGMVSIGSTPSFAVMRSFEDWDTRFAAFYVLRPHGAFTQVTDVTDPFPQDRPSPIAPIEVSLDEIDAIVAYVAGLAPADLGKPLEHQ